MNMRASQVTHANPRELMLCRPSLNSYLKLGAPPSAVPCARLHARHVLREWGMSGTRRDH